MMVILAVDHFECFHFRNLGVLINGGVGGGGGGIQGENHKP